ncbi:PAS domain S-box protein [Actinoplanes sp. NPDC049802]|uniref:hybrid sensor histidine kinase/response regulator n=1 Tax=Actinoplanes sp. NPDC049802 TaxID=3154742 RepID=UPI0033EF9B79
MSASLEITDDQLLALVATLPGRVLVIDPDSGVILAASPGSQRLLDPGDGALPGSAVTDVLPEMPADWLAGDAAAKLRRVDRRGCPVEVRMVRVGRGTRRALVVTVDDGGAPGRDEHAGAVLSSVVSSAADAVIVCDPQGRITLWNAAAERIYGYRQGEVRGRPVSMLYPPEVAEHNLSVFRRALAGEPTAQLDTMRLRRDGKRLPMRMSFAPVTESDGSVTGVVSVAHELSRQKRDEARMAALLRATPDAIVGTDSDGRIMFVNESCERMLGYRAHELVGRQARVLFTEDVRQTMIDLGTRLFADPVLRASTHTIATRMRRKDGSVLPGETTISWLDDLGGLVMIAATRDLTALRRAESKLHGVLEAVPEAVTGISPDGRIVLVNQATERLLGHPREWLLGRPYAELLPDDARDTVDQAVAEVFADPDAVTHRVLYSDVLRADGSRVTTENNVTCFHAEGDQMLLVAGRDITDRLAAEAERAALVEQVQRQKAEQSALRAQRLESLGQLAGGVAHDFNNLLAVILNYASLLGGDIAELAADDPQRWRPFADDLTKIEHAAQRGAALTQQLLVFSRRDIHRPQVLDPAAVLTGLRPLLNSAVGEQNRLHVDIQQDLPAVRLDPGQLEQMLVNLTVNSRDAMPGGGDLRITAEAGRPAGDDLDCQPPPEPGRCYLRLRISDDGVGMTDDVARRAFEPFFTTKPKGRGTGLGLATVYGIVAQADGCLGLRSRPGEGTTVTILLPVTDEPPPAAPAGTPGPGDTTTAPAPRTILLVDDEEAVRDSTARVLARHGYRLLTAAGGQEALDLVRRHPDDIDILLTDMVMPNMHGVELAQHVAELIPAVQVIYMSGYAEPLLNTDRDHDETIYLLEKPFTTTALIQAVRALTAT